MQAQALERAGVTTMGSGRNGKLQIGGHFDPKDVFTLQELLMRESRERGTKKTMQEALEEMVADYCKKHGVTLPSTAETPSKGKG